MANLNIDSNIGDALCGYLMNIRKGKRIIPEQIEVHQDNRNSIIKVGSFYNDLLFYSMTKEADDVKRALGKLVEKMIEEGSATVKELKHEWKERKYGKWF